VNSVSAEVSGELREPMSERIDEASLIMKGFIQSREVLLKLPVLAFNLFQAVLEQ
jgi:hypothetical protein